MKTVTFASGERWPPIALGTWHMGERRQDRAAEIVAIRQALDLGYRLIDTAEMYGDGVAEEIVGQALDEAFRAGSVTRDEIFVVSKVYPHHATRDDTVAACERSRLRLGLDTIDLYLLHWRGSVPLRETIDAFQVLHEQRRIGLWGVSNFDTPDLDELWGLEGGSRCATNQVYYSLTARGPEYDLLPWQREQRLPLMAYSPLDQGALVSNPLLREFASARDVTPAQVALAWAIGRGDIIAIAKAVSEPHLRGNLSAREMSLSESDRAELDRLFPPPRRKLPLAMR